MSTLNFVLIMVIIAFFGRSAILKGQRDYARDKRYELNGKVIKLEKKIKEIEKELEQSQELAEAATSFGEYAGKISTRYLKRLAEEYDKKTAPGSARQLLEKLSTISYEKKSFKHYSIDYHGINKILLNAAPEKPEPKKSFRYPMGSSSRSSSGLSTFYSGSSPSSSSSSSGSSSYDSSYSSYDSSSYSSYDSDCGSSSDSGGGSCD